MKPINNISEVINKFFMYKSKFYDAFLVGNFEASNSSSKVIARWHSGQIGNVSVNDINNWIEHYNLEIVD